jgi:myo-inositol 2-dehydrogenase/D-chiro-inositol 1-dehydrogenase
MKIAMIGAGRWAGMHHDAIRTLQGQGERVQLERVLSASQASAARVSREWGVQAGTDLDAFLAPGIDAVIVASPNDLHHAHALAALRAGLPLLLEKPMALTSDAADEIRLVAERAGLVVALGHEMRAFSWAQAVKDAIDSGRVGTVRHLTLDLWRRPYRGGAGGWKADPRRLGSSILEEPVHYLDLARWWLGDPLKVSAVATSRAAPATDWENLDVTLHYSGAVARVSRSVAAFGHRVDVTVNGDAGAMRLVWDGRLDSDTHPRVEGLFHDLKDRDAPPEVLNVRTATGHAFDLPRQLQAFVRAVRGEGAPLASAADGVAAVRLCERVEGQL